MVQRDVAAHCDLSLVTQCGIVAKLFVNKIIKQHNETGSVSPQYKVNKKTW